MKRKNQRQFRNKETSILPPGVLTAKQPSLLPGGPRDLPPCIMHGSQGPALSNPTPILVLCPASSERFVPRAEIPWTPSNSLTLDPVWSFPP